MIVLITILLVIIIAWIYWRYYYFFLDPERNIPSGNNIVSPADGKVVYVKKISKNKVPIIIKEKKSIELKDIIKTKLSDVDKYIVGIFMTPFDVHVNRAPIQGKINYIKHHKNKFLPMTRTWINCIFNKKPLYSGSPYLLENERKITLIQGAFQVLVVQIADVYVNKIVSYVKKSDIVKKGDRIGMIKMGSQVDLIFPDKRNMKILVKEGDKVKAGESIIATY